jgi:hypothetical protein
MNNLYSYINLQEAKQQLDEIFFKFDSVEEGEFEVLIRHLYHHLNTAHNCRYLDQDDCFNNAGNDSFYESMEKFPKDIWFL